MSNITIRNQKLFCLNCGGEFDLALPIPISEFKTKQKAFDKLHNNCKPTWKQPTVEQSKSEQEKMMFWLTKGERGISSEVMFETISGHNLGGRKSPPSDPDDFKRCYLLLETIPEWKTKLNELRKISPTWNNLVDNWDKLTELLEEQLRTHKANGMYEFMKKLGC